MGEELQMFSNFVISTSSPKHLDAVQGLLAASALW